MKMLKVFVVSIFLVLNFASAAVSRNTGKVSADEVLQKVSDKLSALKSLKYKYRQEYNYKSEAYFRESSAETFLEFTPNENIVGLKFQFTDRDTFIAYNGSEIFSLAKKDKTIRVESKPKSERLFSSSYLQFSPLMWRNALPKIIADKTIAKTLSEIKMRDAGYFLIEFALDKSFIDSGNGEILPMTLNRKTIYRLTIDKQSFLPTEVYRGNNVNQDFNKAFFSEIAENPAPPNEKSWYFSTYLNEYKYAEPPKDNLIKANETVYDLNLPMFGNDRSASLDDYKGKLVLLEFWIFHCGYCQAAVPKLNALQKKYKDKDFKLLTVNTADSENMIKLFIEKTESEFPILYNGAKTAEKYGVINFPTVILIGKDGKVIYSGGFDHMRIEELIDRNL